MLILLKSADLSTASAGAPASLPHIGLLFERSYSLTADQGTYSVSGQDVAWSRNYVLPAAQGTYTFTGQDAALASSLRVLVAGQGSYVISGQDAAFSRASNASTPAPFPHLSLLGGLGSNLLIAGQGSYTFSGQDASLKVAHVLSAASGTYTVSGQVAALSPSLGGGGDAAPLPHLGLLLQAFTDSYTLTADAGSYSIIGSDGLADFEMSAATSTYSITGQDAGLRKASVLTAASGTYSITGQDAALSIGGTARTMTADYGTYSITGQAATLKPARKGSMPCWGRRRRSPSGRRSATRSLLPPGRTPSPGSRSR